MQEAAVVLSDSIPHDFRNYKTAKNAVHQTYALNHQFQTVDYGILLVF